MIGSAGGSGQLHFDLGPVAPEYRQQYRDDGVVCLRAVVDPDSVVRLRHAVDAIVANPQPRARRRTEGASAFFIIQGNAGRHEIDIRRFAENTEIKRIAADVMESAYVELFNEVVFVKQPGAGETEWHNDYSYMSLSGTKICTIWIALDRVSADTGAMFFARGSHTERKLYRPVLLGTGRERPTGEEREAVPDVWSAPAGDLISFDLNPGDCTIHDAWTLHGAKPNGSRTEPRRGIAIRYIGDDVTPSPLQFGVLNAGSASD